MAAEQFGSKVSSAAQRTVDDGAELYGKAKDKAQSALEAGRETFENVTAQGRRQIESVSGVIRDWPLLSIGVAFAAGFLASRLFSR